MPGSISEPGNTIGFGTDGSPNQVVQRGNSGEITGQHYLSVGSAPAAAAGANAGTTPPSPVVAATSDDARGSLTAGTGSAPSAGPLVAITFNQAFAVAPVVTIAAGNDATAALAPFVTSVTTTGFVISAHNAPSASQPNTTYAFEWIVEG